MLGRQSVKITYTNKRRRVQNASKKLFSSPLEVLPPDTDDLTRNQMARRMLKRSRRIALAEQLEDKNVEPFREHLAKRIKHTQERVSNPKLTGAPLDLSPQDDSLFQTPFPSSQPVHESAVAEPVVQELLSPVPVPKRVTSGTSSRNPKESGSHSQILASPFSSRPGSVAPSPKHKRKGPPFHRTSRTPLHAKSRTLSAAFKENTRRILRKDSTISLRDANRECSAKPIRHQRRFSGPSTAYMRSQFAQEDWISPPKVFSRAFSGYDAILSPGSVHSNSSFYADQPQSCSTPAVSRLQNLSDPHRRQARPGNFLLSSVFSPHDGSSGSGDSDVEMTDTAPHRRQTIHLPGNSIFSSSDEFTIGLLSATHDEGMANDTTSRNEIPTHGSRQILSHREAVDRSQAGRSLAGSFVAEYAVPLDRSPSSTIGTKAHAREGSPKSSIGKQLLSLPGTSPVHDENLVIRASDPDVHKLSVWIQNSRLPGISPARRNNLVIRRARYPGTKPSVRGQPLGLPGTSLALGENLAIRSASNSHPLKSSVGEQLVSLPGTSPVRGESLVIRASWNTGTLTPPSPETNPPCPPPSPVSDLALELHSMDIRGNPNTRLEGESHPAIAIPHQVRSHPLQDVSAEPNIKKSVKRQPVRNRAGTIRASDFAKSGAHSGGASETTIPSLSNVRRTRSGTVVGPEPTLATKAIGLPTRSAKGAPAARLATVQSGSESESDDELLLKDFWTEGLVYLGRAASRGVTNVEADELNLGGSESGPPRRPGLRRR